MGGAERFRDGYAVIGWGSLIWDLDDLAEKVAGPWAMGAGPRLPLEFSRISPKRLMSLVVVLDDEHGALCPTCAIRSRRDDIEAVAEDLRRRERAPTPEGIGAVCLATGLRRSSSAAIADRAAAWCGRVGARGAVWTDLPRNFQAIVERPFTPEAGRAYLGTLAGASLAEAKRYIDGAPAETDTPLRRLLARDPWWRGLARATG